MKKNWMLCIDLLTFLQHDRCPLMGKGYKGHLVVKNDGEACFVEEGPKAPARRNPCIYRGYYFNLHRCPDGYIFPTFTRPDYTPTFGVAEYLEEASEELMMVALAFRNARKGLVEK